MNLGDFFKSAATSRPVLPKPVQFTAVSRNEILPGGGSNPGGRPIAATIKAALAFIGGDGALNARVEARKALAAKYKDLETDAGDYFVELTYQIVWRSLHEWDEKEQLLGARLFPDVDSLREMVEVPESDRLLRVYNAYVKEEHPEGGPADAASFPEAGKAGA